MERRIKITHPTWKHYIILFPFYFFIRLWQKSVRIKAETKDALNISDKKRMIGLAWHSTIFFLPMCKYIFRPNFPMAGLVSASKDGAWLCAFFRLLNIGAVRGSSSRRGAGAIFDLIDKLKESDVFITPDGPRGPKEIAKAGFITVAKESNARILLIRIIPKRFITLKSWDRFILPLPFSSAKVETLNFDSIKVLEDLATSAGVSPQQYVSDYLNAKW